MKNVCGGNTTLRGVTLARDLHARLNSALFPRLYVASRKGARSASEIQSCWLDKVGARWGLVGANFSGLAPMVALFPVRASGG